MDKLKFPIIKKELPASKWLSMNEYLKFVIFNLKHADRKAINEWRNLLAVNVPFSLK